MAAVVPLRVATGASTSALIDGGGNDFDVGGLSGTLALAADGDDTITVAGIATQWLVDAGSGADSIAITKLAQSFRARR